jgi:hypothetical protein
LGVFPIIYIKDAPSNKYQIYEVSHGVNNASRQGFVNTDKTKYFSCIIAGLSIFHNLKTSITSPFLS